MQEKAITQSRLKELFDYNPETGELTRKVSPMHLFPEGSKAGRRNATGSRYVDICIDKKRYVLHRIIWLYVYGEWPPKDIDHINRDRTDNRLSNLRLVERFQNSQNKGVQSNSTNGFKGVTKMGDKWRARISVNKKRISLGLFDSAMKAGLAYMAAALAYQSHAPEISAMVKK